ncbi:MAG: cytochrome c biogenesis protein ResB [Candidatus Saccharicenans sp.]|nr:cytochrome c biogenesis protein ResB [Candidatus Saccharicenans sp.]
MNPKGAWKFLTSVRLAIALLILIIVLATVGTFIPQEREAEFYQKNLPGISGLVLPLGLDHLYRSPLFLSLVFLFLLNLIFCSLQQIPAKFRRLKTDQEAILSASSIILEPQERSHLERWLETDLIQLTSIFRKRHYRVRVSATADGKTFLARKGWPGLFGPELVHLGLIIIIAGGLISAIFSQRISLALVEGQTEKIPGRDFSLRLDRFTTEYYPDGSVRDWKSLVSVLENDQVRLQKTIEVNHPLKYAGMSFFQMSYGHDWDRTLLELEIVWSQSRRRTVTLKVGETIHLEDGARLRALSFIPDFQVDDSGQAYSRSAEAANPAALVEMAEGDKQVFLGWVFHGHPELSRYQRRTGPELKVDLKNFSAPSFSVLEASSDPGTDLVWAGSGLLVLGLLASFYLPYREVRLKQRVGSPPVLLTYARKNRDAFHREVKTLLSLANKKDLKDKGDE